MIPRVTITNDLTPKNANATSNFLQGIRIRPVSVLPFQQAILKQEIYEWWYCRKTSAVMALPVLAGAAYLVSQGFNPVLCIAIALMLTFALQMNLYIPFSKRMELTSHAAEYIWAIEVQGADPVSYIEGEVRSLARGYPKFRSWTPDQLRAGMKAREPAARKWLRGQS
jgi:hypothetical protein